MPLSSRNIPFVFDRDGVETELQRQCDFLFKHLLGMDVALKLDFPIPDNFSRLINQNQSLNAHLTLTWMENNETINIKFPAPFHGVFIIRSDFDSVSTKRCWIPLLIEKQGEWILKKYKENGTELVYLKAFPGGKYFELPIDTKQELIIKKKVPTVTYLDEEKIEFAFLDEKTALRQKFIEKIKSLKNTKIEPVDEQDLCHHRLQTFNNYVVERFLTQMLNCITSVFRNNQRYFEIIRSNEHGISNKEREEFWSGLKERQSVIGWQLVPINYLVSAGKLELFSPLNNIDAISQLTSLKRYPYSKNLPAIYHQNHPSFKNIICPIETAESSEVGITVHLAKGVTTDIWGNLIPSENPDTYLGYGASLVPFYQHNDAVRVMMGAKNLRQAVPLSGSEPPLIKTGNEDDLLNLVNPLYEHGLVPDEFGKYEPGRTLLVAYMPWYGYNFEDAIVANRDLITNGQLNWEYHQHYSQYLLPGFIPNLDRGLERIGKTIHHGDLLAEFSNAENIQPLFHNAEEGVLTALEFLQPSSTLLGGVLRWSVKYTIPLQVGSKLMARYGNKGVVAKFFPSDQMPKLPDDENLSEDIRGKSVDLLLNPHGVISRMNLGQLLETQYTMAAKLGFDLPLETGKAFTQTDHSPLSNFFKNKPPFDKYGRVKLQLPDESFTESPVTVGYEYFTVLKHVPSRKAHVRRGGHQSDKYNIITGQPVGGKANKGGQRIGEMEFWALAAHQADNIINEFITHRSDPAWSSASQHTQTTQAILDHLFALGIKFDGKGNIEVVSDSDVKRKSKRLLNDKTRVAVKNTSFSCPKCGWKLFGGEKIMSTANSQRSSVPEIDVKSVLDHLGYEFQDIPNKVYSKPGSNFVSTEEVFELSSNKSAVSLEIKLKKSTITIRLKILDNLFVAKSRFDKDFKLTHFPSMLLSCPKHSSEKLTGIKVKQIAQSVLGGLYDPEIFGTANLLDPDLKWGNIELKEPVKHPFFDDYTLKIIPILPLKYRFVSPVSFLARGEEHDLTKAYANVFQTSAQDTLDDKAKLKLERAVIKLYRLIKQRTFGKSGKSKFGLLRRHGLGRRVDYSGRLVIVPDPTLDWDEVSIPINVLAVLYGGEISKVADNQIVKEYFKSAIDKGLPIPDEPSVKKEILNYLEKNPTRVLLNRAPSLHKYNILSFKPVPHPIEEGMVLKLNPLVFKGFGADADGDEMAIHALLDEKSILEANRLSPTHSFNVLSVASGEPILDFDQDFVLGNFLISGEKKPGELTRIKKVITSKSDFKDRILSEMHSAFDKVTSSGVSFSYLELLDYMLDKGELKKAMKSDEKHLNQTLEELTKKRLEKALSDPSYPGYYFAAMALSGARGSKQTRQVIGARGMLSPGLVGFDAGDNQFRMPESLTSGMTPDSSYMSTYNARSSMIDKNIGTFKAGYFMRKLVLALWSWQVQIGDCGEKSFFTCKLLPERKICTGCYEVDVPDKYPAGLIAAQSIGERCTQLTMSSFHSGDRGISLSDVEGMVNDIPESFENFYENLHKVSALNNIQKEHFKLLWLVIKTSPKSNLNSAINSNYTPLASTVGIGGFRMILDFLGQDNQRKGESPIERIMMSEWEGINHG
ncbi:MAG: hypothetical protein HQ510_03950 [Candidatus Marinimicrobia bacterium]|nr:hypothetical protein [Candidatus Neomarinimicrobiota bacterium]